MFFTVLCGILLAPNEMISQGVKISAATIMKNFLRTAIEEDNLLMEHQLQYGEQLFGVLTSDVELTN
jgi:hypothetical protein